MSSGGCREWRQATPLPWRGCRTWWTEPKPSLGLLTSLSGWQLFLGWLPQGCIILFPPLLSPTSSTCLTKPGPRPPATFTPMRIRILTTINKAIAGEKTLETYIPVGLYCKIHPPVFTPETEWRLCYWCFALISSVGDTSSINWHPWHLFLYEPAFQR